MRSTCYLDLFIAALFELSLFLPTSWEDYDWFFALKFSPALEFFFGLLSLTRFGFNIGLLDRPVTFGLIGALITGNIELSIGIGIFFELVWLDFFPAGTFIPPHNILPPFLTLALANFFDITYPGNLIPLLFLTFPTAWLGTRMENWQRKLQNLNYNKLYYWADQEHSSFKPEALVVRSLIQLVILNIILYLVCFTIIFVIIEYTYPFWSDIFEGFKWPYLWLVALVGGILSLRIPRAYEVLVFCLGIVFLTSLFIWDLNGPLRCFC